MTTRARKIVFGRLSISMAGLLGGLLMGAPADETAPMLQAVRNGDSAYLKTHLKTGLEVRDRRGATPLMHAAAFGNIETLKILLEAGADVNARNDTDASALLWAAADPARARILIEHGADVKVRSKQGRTPLMVAAMRAGNAEILSLILSKGADVHAKDRFSVTALNIAARSGDLDSVKLLIAKGADPNPADGIGRSSLFAATMGQNPEVVHFLLQRGADVRAATMATRPPGAAARSVNNIKNGPPNNSNVTALHNAAAFGPVKSVAYLLAAGANVNARDSRNLVPLSFALAGEYPSLEIVRTLIRAGADVNIPDSSGDTPLDWAEKFGYPDIVAELKAAGAKQSRKFQAPAPPAGAVRPEPAVALGRALKLLESSSTTFFNGSGCVSCHHQNLIARVQPVARAAGVPANAALEREQALQMKAQWTGLQDDFLQGILPGGGANRLAENLLGLKAAGYPPDSITDSAIVAIAAAQDPDGGWGSGEVQHRPPIAQSPFSATTRVIRVLQDYSIPARRQEFAQRIGRARVWLMKARVATTEDYAMRLSGLHYAGAPPQDIRKAAKALLALQRSDGGWGGNPHMKSDAYATGVALMSLAESKALTPADSAYRRGTDYLLSTQFPDGSWYVRGRSIKFQPYFESGFPFGHDQWISIAATAWAAQAIAVAMEADAIRLTSAQNRR